VMLDNDLLSDALREPRTNDFRNHTSRPARWKRNDEVDRSIGKALGAGRAAQSEPNQQQQERAQRIHVKSGPSGRKDPVAIISADIKPIARCEQVPEMPKPVVFAGCSAAMAGGHDRRGPSRGPTAP
jgi:hypothetical protein